MARMQYLLRSSRKEVWGLLGLGVVVAFGMAWMIQGGDARLAIAGALVTVLGGLVVISPRVAIVVTFIFLTVLGDFRRALVPLTGWPSEDPLLLVGPAVAILLVGCVVAVQQLRLSTHLSRWILLLMLLMALQVVNPGQGSLFVGMAGALFYVVPLLWFWIGRSYATPQSVAFLLYRVVVPLAVLAALLGVYQAFFGLLPFQQHWADRFGYAALNVGGYIRPISFFTSAAEYAFFVIVALVLLWASWLKRARGSRIGGLVLIPLLALALFLISSRGVVVMGLFTAALLWAVQARSPTVWFVRLVLGSALGVAVLVLVLPHLQSVYPTGRVGALVAHQASGFLDPLNPEVSTLREHVSIFLGGFAEGLAHPLGQGLGVTTLATYKYGSTASTVTMESTSTEVDLSNVFVSLGVVGGAVYIVIVALALLSALRYWHVSRTLVALAILGMLVVQSGQWLTGSHYALSALTWFCIGALDKFQESRRSGDENRYRNTQGNQGRRAGTRELRGSVDSSSSRASGGLGGQRNSF